MKKIFSKILASILIPTTLWSSVLLIPSSAAAAPVIQETRASISIDDLPNKVVDMAGDAAYCMAWVQGVDKLAPLLAQLQAKVKNFIKSKLVSIGNLIAGYASNIPGVGGAISAVIGFLGGGGSGGGGAVPAVPIEVVT